MQRGDLEKAEAYYNRALLTHREIGYRRGEAAALAGLGFVYYWRRDLSRARDYLQQAQRIHTAIGAGGRPPDTVRMALDLIDWLERDQHEHGEENPVPRTNTLLL